MIIKLVTLTRASRKADRSVSIAFNTTTEQSSNEMAELDSMFQQTCLLAIKEEETPFLDSELKDLDNIDLDLEDTTKTPSKRLRNVLYCFWGARSGADMEFKDFYKTEMEKIITHYKGKLE
jgi:hypothetical protein